MSSPSASKYVDHTYRDFSHYVEEGGELVRHKKSHDNFPKRLHKLVSGNHSDVITWMVSDVIGVYCNRCTMLKFGKFY